MNTQLKLPTIIQIDEIATGTTLKYEGFISEVDYNHFLAFIAYDSPPVIRVPICIETLNTTYSDCELHSVRLHTPLPNVYKLMLEVYRPVREENKLLTCNQ